MMKPEIMSNEITPFEEIRPPEVITSRADRTRPNMGLTNWEGARIRRTDVSIAKNYLSEPELRALGKAKRSKKPKP
jgi:hypothetical protein